MKNVKDLERIEKEILKEKLKGTPDIKIGEKLGVSYKFIEKVVTKFLGITVNIQQSKRKTKEFYPKNFSLETTTLWSFKNRGNWATHSNEYRGNWSPYIPRNIILKYSSLGDIVLDYFCGGGTTAIEAKLLGRKCIAIDINEKAVELAKKNTSFEVSEIFPVYEPEIKVGDARDLSFIKNESIDLICSHPPYANIIHYTNQKDGDLSFLSPEIFLKEMKKVAEESYRVLKPGKKCVLLIGDIRKKRHIFPLGFKLIDVFFESGFILREIIIKRQHNCKTTGFWYKNSIKYNFLLLAHEYLLVFEKSEKDKIEIKEDFNTYQPMHLNNIEFRYKRKIPFFETSTIWFFPPKKFEEVLNKNVISRYSKNQEYKVFAFYSLNKCECLFSHSKSRKIDLLYFKLPEFLNFSLSNSQIQIYLSKMKEIILQEISHIKEGGYIVIETKDVRENEQLYPLAKEIVKMFDGYDSLWLKEIVIVAPENYREKGNLKESFFRIVHNYLLIFEKI